MMPLITDVSEADQPAIRRLVAPLSGAVPFEWIVDNTRAPMTQAL